MNIFILDKTPAKCAQYLHNCHLNKMTTELAQLLSTAIWVLDCNYAESAFGKGKLFGPTHTKHPCAIWVRESYENYTWSWNLLIEMNKEWWYRKSKPHGSFVKTIYSVQNLVTREHLFKKHSKTPFPLCMPDKYKQDDPVAAYRHYYMCEKMFDKNGKSLMNWGNREKPYWILGYEV